MHPREEILFEAILLAGITMVTIIISFVLTVIGTRRKFRLINQQKIEEQVHKLEAERKRIAEDMHDEVGPVLSATKYKLESLVSFSENERPEVAHCIYLVDEVITKIRQVSNGLMLNTLVHHGLEAAINEFLADTQIAAHMQIETDITLPAHLPDATAVHIFRIIQEITHNAVKHAKAKNLQIKMYPRKQTLFILTADNGCGFNTRSPENNAGLGLNNIKNRVILLNGELNVKSVDKKGTFYHIELPCHN